MGNNSSSFAASVGDGSKPRTNSQEDHNSNENRCSAAAASPVRKSRDEVATLLERLDIDWFTFDLEFDAVAALLSARLLTNSESFHRQPPHLQQQQQDGVRLDDCGLEASHHRPHNANRPAESWAPLFGNCLGDATRPLVSAPASGGPCARSAVTPNSAADPSAAVGKRVGAGDGGPCPRRAAGTLFPDSNSNANSTSVSADFLAGLAMYDVGDVGVARLARSLPAAQPLRRGKTPQQHRLPSLNASAGALAPLSRQPHPPPARAVSQHNSSTSMTEDPPVSASLYLYPHTRGLERQSSPGSSTDHLPTASALSRSHTPVSGSSPVATPLPFLTMHVPTVASPMLRIAVMDLEYVGVRRLIDALGYIATGESRGMRSRAWIEASHAATTAPTPAPSSATPHFNGSSGAEGGGFPVTSLRFASHGLVASGAPAVLAVRHLHPHSANQTHTAPLTAGTAAAYSPFSHRHSSSNGNLSGLSTPRGTGADSQHTPLGGSGGGPLRVGLHTLHPFSPLSPAPQQHQQQPMGSQRVSATSFGEQSYNNVLLATMHARSNMSLSTSVSSLHGGGGYSGVFASNTSRSCSRSELMQAPRTLSHTPSGQSLTLSRQASSTIPFAPLSGTGDRRSTESYVRRGYYTHAPCSYSSASPPFPQAATGSPPTATSGTYAGGTSTLTNGAMVGALPIIGFATSQPPGFPTHSGGGGGVGGGSIGWSGSGSLNTAGECGGLGSGSSPSHRLSRCLSHSQSLVIPSAFDPTDDRGACLTGLAQERVLELLCDLFAHLHLRTQDVADFLLMLVECVHEVQQQLAAMEPSTPAGGGDTAAPAIATAAAAGSAPLFLSGAGIRAFPEAAASQHSRRPSPPQLRALIAELVDGCIAPMLSTATQALAVASRPCHRSTTPLRVSASVQELCTPPETETVTRPHTPLQPIQPLPALPHKPASMGEGVQPGAPTVPSAPPATAASVMSEADARAQANEYFRERATLLVSIRGGGLSTNPAADSPSQHQRLSPQRTVSGNSTQSHSPQQQQQRATGSHSRKAISGNAHPQQQHPPPRSMGSCSQYSAASLGISGTPATGNSTTAQSIHSTPVRALPSGPHAGHVGGTAGGAASLGVGDGRALKELLVQKTAFVFHYAEQLVYQMGSDLLLRTHEPCAAPTTGATTTEEGSGGNGFTPRPPAAAPGFRQQQQHVNSANPSREISPSPSPRAPMFGSAPAPSTIPSTTASPPSPPLPPQTTYATTTLWPLRTRMVSLREHYLYVYDAVGSTFVIMGGAWHQQLTQAAGGSDLHTPIALCDTARAHGGDDFCLLSGPNDVELLGVHPSRLVKGLEQMQTLQDAAHLRAKFHSKVLQSTGDASRSGSSGATAAAGSLDAPGQSVVLPLDEDENGRKAASRGGGSPAFPFFIGSSGEDVEVHRVRNRERKLFLLTLPHAASATASAASYRNGDGGAGSTLSRARGTARDARTSEPPCRDAADGDDDTDGGDDCAAMWHAAFQATPVVRPGVLSLQGPGGAGSGGAGHSGSIVGGGGGSSDFHVVSGTEHEEVRVYPLRFLSHNVIHHLFFQSPTVRAQWYQRLTALIAVNASREHFLKTAAAPVDCGAFIRQRIAYPVGPSAFTCVDMLGAGAFGRVLLVRHKLCGKLFAMKVVRKTGFHSMRNIVEIRRECTILPMLDCPYTMKLHTTFQTDSRIYMLLDYLPGGELLMHTQRAKDHHFDELTSRFYIAQLAVAIEHLRMHGIAHRDVKGDNLVLDEDGNLVLTDFGFAKKITVDEDLHPAQGDNPPGRVVSQRTSCGTRAYIAPEVLSLTSRNDGYGLEVDWWSMGVVLFTLVTGFFPFLRQTDKETNEAIISGPLQFPHSVPLSDATKDLIASLLHKDPAERITTLARLKTHRFFNGFDWDACEQRRLRPPIQLHKDAYTRPSSHESAMRRLKKSVFTAIALNENGLQSGDDEESPLRRDAQRAAICVCAPPPPVNARYAKELQEELGEMTLVESAYGRDTLPYPTQPQNDVLSPLYDCQERCGSVRDLEQVLQNRPLLSAYGNVADRLIPVGYGDGSGGGGGADGAHPLSSLSMEKSGERHSYIPALTTVHPLMQQQSQLVSLASGRGYASGSASASASPLAPLVYFEAVVADYNEAAYDSAAEMSLSVHAQQV